MEPEMENNFIPSHYSDLDLNSDANNSNWPLGSSADRSPSNGDSSNRSSSSLLSSRGQILLCCNNDAVKQAVLRHEAVFKEHLFELHHLYWKQKELMDEMRSNNSAKPHHLSLETLKSNPFLSQASQQNTQETSRLPEFPWMNPASSVPSFISVAKNSELLSTHHSESRCMIIGKKVLDLELPCSEYIDSDEEKSVKLMRELFAVTRKSTDLHMGGPSSSDNLIPGSNSAMKQCFDLNEPINIEEESNELVIKLEDEAGPISGFSIDLNELFKLPEPPSDNEAGEIEVTPPFLGSSETVGQSEVNPPSSGFSNAVGQTEATPILGNSELVGLNKVNPSSSGSSELVEPAKVNPQYLSVSTAAGQTKVGPSSSGSNDAVGQSVVNLPSPASIKALGRRKASCKSSGFSEVGRTKVAPSSSSSGKAIGKSKETQSSGFSEAVGSCSCKAKNLKQAAQNSVPSSASSLRKPVHELVKSRKVVLGLPCRSTAKKLFKGRGSHKNLVSGPIGGKPASANNSSTRESVFKRVDGQSSESSNDIKGPIVNRNSCASNEHESMLTSSSLPTLLAATPISSLSKESSPPRGESGKTQMETTFQEPMETLKEINFQEPMETQVETTFEVSIQTDSDVQQEAMETQMETTFQVLVKEDSDVQQEAKETEQEAKLPEKLVETAAEALVSISSSIAQTGQQPATCGPSIHTEGNILNRFADTVLSGGNNQNDHCNKSVCLSGSELDYFELMTLQLTEINVEELQQPHVSKGPMDQKADETRSCASSMRRSRTQRCRPCEKDFNSEILSSINSLLKREANEDLYRMEGLIKASRSDELGAGPSTSRSALRGARRSEKRSANNRLAERGNRRRSLVDCERSLVGWENIPRARRGTRRRNTNAWSSQSPDS